MPRPWIEAGVAQAVEQHIDAGEAVGDAELGPEDRADVLGAEGADAVGGRGAGFETLAEACDLRIGQERGLAGPRPVAAR